MSIRTRTELARTTAEDIHRAVALLSESDRRSVARRLGLPPTTLGRDPHADRLLRARTVARSDEHVVEVIDHLTAGGLLAIVQALGDRAEAPSLDDLTAAVDTCWERLGAGVTALVLAVSIDRSVPAADACATLLDTHAGLLARPEPSPDPEPAEAEPAPSDDDTAKREARRQRKDAQKAAKAAAKPKTGPARYKRKAR
ncbi:MAG: hypothetical protein ACKO2C_10700 [Actinomycetes bacterium]